MLPSRLGASLAPHFSTTGPERRDRFRPRAKDTPIIQKFVKGWFSGPNHREGSASATTQPTSTGEATWWSMWHRVSSQPSRLTRGLSQRWSQGVAICGGSWVLSRLTRLEMVVKVSQDGDQGSQPLFGSDDTSINSERLRTSVSNIHAGALPEWRARTHWGFRVE